MNDQAKDDLFVASDNKLPLDNKSAKNKAHPLEHVTKKNILNLPNYLVKSEIFSTFKRTDLFAAGSVCKNWYSMASKLPRPIAIEWKKLCNNDLKSIERLNCSSLKIHHCQIDSLDYWIPRILESKKDQHLDLRIDHMTTIHLAAKYGNIEAVTKCLDRVNYGYCEYREDYYINFTPIYYAQDAEILKLLIKKGAYVNNESKNSERPLHYATNVEIAKILIEYGADINAKTSYGFTPLHSAVKHGFKEVAAFLLEKGLEKGAKLNNEGLEKLLYNAVQSGNMEIVSYCLAQRVNVNINNQYVPILSMAIEKGYKDIAELLISHSVDVNEKDSLNEATSVHYASKKGYEDTLEILINKGADIHKITSGGCTPLHNAADYGHTAIVETLIQNGADVNPKDKYGRTPLHNAAKNGSKEIVETLIKNGADVNPKDNDGRTPLHNAAKNGSKEIVETLIKNGADVNPKDNDDRTPLHGAAENGSKEIVETLIKNEADVNAKDKDGRTPKEFAAEKKRLFDEMMKNDLLMGKMQIDW